MKSNIKYDTVVKNKKLGSFLKEEDSEEEEEVKE